MPWSRIVAIAALAALIPITAVSSLLVLAVCATGVVVALAVRDTLLVRRLGAVHGPSAHR